MPQFRGQATVLDFALTLPPERRNALREATLAERTAIRPYRLELRRARIAARNVLLVQPFDVERFKQAQQQVLAAETRARTAAQDLLHAVVLKLTPEERVSLAHFQRTYERPWRQRPGQPGEAIEDGEPATTGKPTATKP